MSTIKIAPQIQQMRASVLERISMKDALRPQEGEDVITVDRIASKLAYLYEKLRYSVDNKEEHLLRRSAIDRILARRLSETFRRGSVSRFLVTELVRAGYLPNNELPERILGDVEDVVQKIVSLIEQTSSHPEGVEARGFLTTLAAMEIEEILFPSVAMRPTLDAYYLTVRDLVEIKDQDIADDVRHTQIYIACARSLFGYDEKGLFWVLWNLHTSSWRGAQTEEELSLISHRFIQTMQTIRSQIDHPLNWRLMPKLRDFGIFFQIIQESITKKPDLWTKEQLSITDVKRHMSDVLAEKYDLEKSLIKRRVNRTIIYILITKTVLAFLVELPYDRWRYGEVHRVPLLINIFFHPFLLFVMTRIVKLPKSDSRTFTLERIEAIITNQELPQIVVRIHRRKSLFGAVLAVTYLFFFGLVFAGIVWTLDRLQFNIVSGGLFIFFLTLVSYFGLRIRARARRWRVAPKSDSMTSFLIDLITLPIVQAGQWFSKKFDSLNVFVFVLDFIVETPFKVIVEIVEGFTQYLREKKESLE